MRHAASPPTATFGWFFRFWTLHRRPLLIQLRWQYPFGCSTVLSKTEENRVSEMKE